MSLEHLKIRSSVINSAIDRSAKTYSIEPYILYKAHFDHFDKEKHSSIEGKDKSEQSRRHNNAIIKRLLPIHVEQKEEMFLNEIEMLSSVKHRNIVTLFGFCVENSEMILIIENLSNGYLGDCVANINNMLIMTWEQRLKICIDIAHALNYLHYEMEDHKVIIHSDIKSDNIGLDEHWRAKIVEFGLSVFMPPNQDDEAFGTKMISGTRSYIDPEYWGNAKIKRESDVYSFGVVLLEILCGRLAYDSIYLKENEKGLAPVARQCFLSGNLEDMIDPVLKNKTSEEKSIINGVPDKDSLNTYFEIAYKCVAETQSQRPTIKFVIKELEKALFFQERVRRPNMDQSINKLEKAMEDQLITHEIHEDRLNADHEREKARELQLRHETLLKNLGHLKICLSDIKLATDNFSETCRIPITEYYTLYRACFDHFERKNNSSIEWKTKDILPWRHNTVVIKRILPRDDKKGEEVFFTEIEMLTSVKHRNIVTLLGFCVEGSEMILVIQNVSNGFLGEYLRKAKDMCILTWEKRLKICIDVAHALSYLHYEMEDEKMTINRDIKSYNIGLDENWEAKIVEFGLSVFVPPNQDDEAIYPNTIVGRIYYRDPEYSNTGRLKRESDVYSFGVILFEILCGRIAYDPVYLKKSDKGLASVARQCFCTETIKDIMDPRLKTETSEKKFILNTGPNKDSLNTFCKVAYQCIAETQGERPTMKVVVKELEKALFLQVNNKDNPRISLEDIQLATQNFHVDNCIGKGGFGNVYRGNLRDGDGVSTIVAKRLDTKSSQGRQQFLSEIQILLEYKHQNIIGLVGYCDEKDEKVIVYEYASMRSLDFHLKDTRLTWVKRLEICIDVARALDFLHEGVGRQAKVIHRDIKPANILLSHKWKAKLADFGLSLISPIDQQNDYIIDHVCGTIGYLDPLYRKSRFLTIESDIYSFGVVLFEILCGRSTFEVQKNEGDHLSSLITKKFEEGKQDEIVFEKIREQIAPKSLTTFQNIAYRCLHHEREKRPTTKEVLLQLEKALRFQMSTGD